MTSDAIVLLKADHQEIRRIFREFQAAGDRAVKKKARLAELEDDVLESYEEHHVADVLCAELSALKPGAERFDAKATVLIENVTHHIEEEEQDWFPKVRAGLGRKQLQELGVRLEEARKKAPRKPAQPSALKKTVDAVIS
jgi:hemerythrin-like domain-containing protein